MNSLQSVSYFENKISAIIEYLGCEIIYNEEPPRPRNPFTLKKIKKK